MREGIIVIPAHGLGTRLHDVTAGRPKALVEVGGEPILARLIRAAAGAAPAGQRMRIVVSARPDDAEIPAFLASYRDRTPDTGPPGTTTIELRRREPRGYLRDLLDFSHELGDEFSVLDCDLITPRTELTRFFADVSVNGADSGHQHAPVDMIVGVSAEPPSGDPRSIRLSARDGVAHIADGAASHLPRAVGAYHWRPAAVASARRFVADSELSRSPGRFHDFVSHLPAERTRIALIRFAAALNVNTADELRLARTYVETWRTRGLD